jgi:hypothetical protein
MESKLKELATGEGSASSKSAASPKTAAGSGAKKKSGGILATIVGAVAGAGGPLGAMLDALKIPGVKAVVGKIGGPVLAAAASALGFPAAAPLLLKYGPTLVDAVAGASSAAGKASSGSSGSTGTSGSKDAERQSVMLELQRLQEKQKEMFGLVSNVLRANHDARMVAINNIR